MRSDEVTACYSLQSIHGTPNLTFDDAAFFAFAWRPMLFVGDVVDLGICCRTCSRTRRRRNLLRLRTNAFSDVIERWHSNRFHARRTASWEQK